MKTFITTLCLTFGILFLTTTESQAQNIQDIVIVDAPNDFSKAKFKKALKKAGIHEKMDINPLVKSLRFKNGQWSWGASQSAIEVINQSKIFKIENNMMTGTIGSSPI